MRVRNLNGATVPKCRCRNTLSHWLRYSGERASKCSVVGCTHRDLVGGHVQKESPADASWYVIPICTSCSEKTGQTLNISDLVQLVSVVPSHACG